MRKTVCSLVGAMVIPIAGCGGGGNSVTSMSSSMLTGITSVMSPKPAGTPTPPAGGSGADLVSSALSPSAPQDNSLAGRIGLVTSTVKDVSAAATLGEKDEPALGESVGISLTNTYPSPQIDPWTKYVAFVGMTVASTTSDQNIHYIFGVLNTDEINACSGPGGYVFVTRGAIKNMKDEAELAGVLAHEMSHVILHHGLAKAKSAAMQSSAMDALKFTKFSKFAKLADVGVTAMLSNPYSQSQETDADAMAVKLMSTAGYTPTSYLHFMQRLAALQANGGGAFSTHPGAADRAKAISDQIETVSERGVTLQARFDVNITH